MQYQIDYTLRVALENEYRSLFTWFIQEIRADGEPASDKLIPWFHNHFFDLQDVRYLVSTEKDYPNPFNDHDADSAVDDTAETRNATFNRRIFAKLVPTGGMTYSMLGTERALKELSLTIQPIACSTDRVEQIRIAGGVGHTYEIDFQDSVQPDWLGVDITVADDTFDALVEQVLGGRHNGSLRLSGADGFYSEWSPSISTNRVKILNQKGDASWMEPDQRLIFEDTFTSSEIEPPRLGRVDRYSLEFVTAPVEAAKPDLSQAPVTMEAASKESGQLDIVGHHAIVQSQRYAFWTTVGVWLLVAFSLFRTC
ncbi:hypothetical protein [Gemmatimonas phototrophica]|uniref:Uncharacterized protein n=1 Tax=Gemmatimonas phototrophica TaxID=1379270 RepID=A0A143BJS8_9BACT|nr:hypothetical protein [Gemmatimonas phototrophica]AMW05327.1 hypothetical protein GEMMAAP_11980 [Gemmatimonas phototrophica]